MGPKGVCTVFRLFCIFVMDLHGKQNSNSQKVCIMLNITYKIIFYIHFLTLFMLAQWCTVECQQNFKVKLKKYLKDIQHVYCIRRKSFPSLTHFINLIKLLKRYKCVHIRKIKASIWKKWKQINQKTDYFYNKIYI